MDGSSHARLAQDWCNSNTGHMGGSVYAQCCSGSTAGMVGRMQGCRHE